jgi:hypothetical protein
MRSDARQRLLAIAGCGLTAKSGVTGVAPLDMPLELQPITPASWKNTQFDQDVTPVTPRHTSKLEGHKRAAGTTATEGFRRGVALGVIAAEGVARLDPARSPCDVPIPSWVQFIDDCRRLIDDGWADCAERLGWSLLDLFGCDSTKPFARVNRAGRLWILSGRRLAALAGNAAAIATASGGYLTFRRSTCEPGGVLAWDLSRDAEAQ